MQDAISSNCKLQPNGNLSAPICTGSKLHTDGDYCLNPPQEQSYSIRELDPIQNYYCDKTDQNCKFCKWNGLNQETTQSDCEPKLS